MPKAKRVKATKRRVTRVKSEPSPFLQNVMTGMKNILSPPK